MDDVDVLTYKRTWGLLNKLMVMMGSKFSVIEEIAEWLRKFYFRKCSGKARRFEKWRNNLRPIADAKNDRA